MPVLPHENSAVGTHPGKRVQFVNRMADGGAIETQPVIHITNHYI
ncbi:MAG: hypothetical protein A07HR60_02745 [uncultured archaeon A07HR60]|nr:MAG: hypothetical protein A07HR60_02745 [uncultured archaeon A07HR60]